MVTECNEIFSGNQQCKYGVTRPHSANCSYWLAHGQGHGLQEPVMGVNAVSSHVTHHINPDDGGRAIL
jgi:hypothetical protein